VFVIGIICMIISVAYIINYRIKNPDKEVNTKHLAFFALFMIISAVGFLSSSDNEPAVNQTQIASMEITEYAKYLVNSALGDKTNVEKPIFRSAINTSEYLVIDMNANDNLSNSLTKTGILADSIDVYTQAFKDRPDLQGLKLVWYLDLVDVKGNTSEGSVLYILIRKENAATINWDNMLTDNIPKVADDYWEHPLFSK